MNALEATAKEAFDNIANTWRSMRAAGDAPHAGAHVDAAGEITIAIAQDCRLALPSATRVPALRVTITSGRPGVAAQVTVDANLNSSDGSYQGPTKIVGQGQFSAADSTVQADFVVLPSGWPALGVGAEATWADGTPHSVALNYVQLELGRRHL